MIGKLTIDKSSMNISYFLYTIRIIASNEGKISRQGFVHEMADFVGVPAIKDNKENRTAYNKSKLPRYFGFVDITTDSDGNSYLVLTHRGKLLLDYIKDNGDDKKAEERYCIAEKHKTDFIDLIFDSVIFDSFGKNNSGAEQSNTDVEPPKVVFKTIYELGKATAEEICYVMFGLNRGVFHTFDEAISKVRERRSNASHDYSRIMEEWEITNIVEDCKIIKLFLDDNISLLSCEKDPENEKVYYHLSSILSPEHKEQIRTIDAVYEPLKLFAYTNGNETNVENWVDSSVLGRVSDSSQIVKYKYGINQDSFCADDSQSSFVPGVFERAILAAFKNEKKNIYLVVQNITEASFFDIIGENAALLDRIEDVQNERHGWSKTPIKNEKLYNWLITQSSRAKTILSNGEVILPSNLHIVGTIIMNNENRNTEFDYEFRRCLVNTAEADDEYNGFEDVLNHNLYGIHIKEQNDALSEEDPHVCIGWSCLGDLSDIDSKEALGALYDEHIHKEARGRGQDIGQVWRFKNDVKIGDYIIFADESVCHIGRIESDYIFDDSERENESSDYKNRRKVTWLKKNIARNNLSTAFHRSLQTAMSIWGLNDYKSSVVELLKGTYTKDIIDDLGESEGVRMIEFKSNIESDLPRNRIWFGAPGTGKSHTLNEEVEKMVNNQTAEYERVTFHPDYSYANFVGTYKPVPKVDENGNDAITYEYVPGPFMRVLKKALENANSHDEEPRPFILVIEEINRANVAAVFGDVFQLLDRDDDNCSEYEIEASEDIKKHLADKLNCSREAVKKLKIPNNMFIWATMNSADQGVFPMDTAFKRRWDFTYLGIDNGDKKIAGKTVTLGKGDYKREVEWNALRKAINAVLSSKDFKINEDKLMGPYFLSTKVIPLEGEIDHYKFVDAFKSKVIMYLFEDAAKQKKHTLFNGCSDTTRYSSIRDEFDTKGVFIFCEEIHNKFPASVQGEGETE